MPKRREEEPPSAGSGRATPPTGASAQQNADAGAGPNPHPGRGPPHALRETSSDKYRAAEPVGAALASRRRQTVNWVKRRGSRSRGRHRGPARGTRCFLTAELRESTVTASVPSLTGLP